MTYLVTYRGNDGALREEEVEAAGRTECVAALKARGITPVSVREGVQKVRRGNGTRSASRSPRVAVWRFCVLAAAAFAVAAAAWWLRGGEKSATRTRPVGSKRIQSVRPVKPTVKPADTNESVGATAAKTEETQPAVETPRPVHVPKYTNIAYRTTARGVLSVHGKPVQPHRRLFKHVSERAIQKLLLVKPGAKVIGNPIPRNFDENFKESLKTEITIEPEDTPEDIEMKKSMIAVKEELARRMANGESPSEVLKAEMAELRKLAKYRSNLQKQVNELKAEGSEEDVKDLRNAANVMLEEHGLKPLPGATIKAD